MNNHATYTKFEEILDLIFTLILIVIIIGGIIYLFYNLTRAEKDITSISMSFTLVSGSVLFYMKWNIVKRTKIKPSTAGELGGVINNPS